MASNDMGGWNTFFSDLVSTSQDQEATDTEIVQNIRSLNETVTFTDAGVTGTSSAYSTALVGTALVGYSEVGP